MSKEKTNVHHNNFNPWREVDMKVRILELNEWDAWYPVRDMFEGKTMRLCKDGHFRFYNKKQEGAFDNKVGFLLFNPRYKEL